MEDNKHYRVRRTEFGHGQSGNINPGRTESYGSTSHRGFGARPDTGRDYEQNIGYRENYDRLDNGQRQRDQRDEWHQDENGLHRGKGPRSHRRTDDRILEDINERLCDNPYLDASDVEVSVKDGEVILAGTVDDRQAKRLAEDIGDAVPGVKNVENRLRVKVQGI